jgi:CubicO group peptidase (beta-lactamase class C family)
VGASACPVRGATTKIRSDGRFEGSPSRRAAMRFRGTCCLVTFSITLALTLVGVTFAPPASAASDAGRQGNQASVIVAIARRAMADDHLRAVILRVTEDDKPIVTRALGTSMTGVPATTAMHFRNGAVAFSYLATLLLEFVDEHKVSLDDSIARWMPTLPEANEVTLKMLANMTSGYPDYETDPTFTTEQETDPFKQWTVPELLSLAFSRPILFPPGTNWSYAHTNMVILGEILQKIGGQPLATLLQDKVLGPMGLTNTENHYTPQVESPVLHAYSSEQRTYLGVPSSSPFYVESTFWSPSWGTPPGAAETTDIDDMTKTAEEEGTGALLSKSSYEAMTGPNLLGFGHALPACEPSCFTQVEGYNYGLGIVRSGSWLLQNPLLSGEGAVEAYLPSKKIAIAVAVTFDPQAFDSQGNYANSSDILWRQIGAYLAPDDAPPIPK